MTEPDQSASVSADPDELRDAGRDIPLTTDADQQVDDELDPNQGEGGAG